MSWQDAEPGDEVRALLLAARAHDGRPEVDETGPLPREFRGGRHLLRHDGGTLVGYAHLDPRGDAYGNQIVEAIVHPDHRGRGHGTRLVTDALAATDGPLRIWSHGDHPAAAAIAGRARLARVRELLRMGLGADTELPEPKLPDDVTIRAFEPGRDEDAVIGVNARAFDWHPEQGQLTVDELIAAEIESWFDPAGFFLADQRGKTVGFHWTKIHPDGVGEVYVVGVDPAAQGGGLGKALTLVGLHHLRRVGIPEIILYVESDNAPAVAVYTRLGFKVTETDVAYQR
ncbi:mycothiol synthase [Actinophytocola gossypii]|uniref:Mycothiol acetyltransferase n=1 Tax=Actinophytocola gossypii TaxID=2812003 RepID=A0ABT2JDI5_9PSEU|nr:mycothiol synthase [Actinophytocola gossypii]MCT2585930.1 mycothiol synthase [Actinophytocola gossypii]